MSVRAQATIHLSALQHNISRVKQLVDSRAILAMVKANAYGHGLLRVVNALSSVDGFGVATVDEALQLQQAGIQKPITVMSGFASDEELALFFQHQWAAVIHDSSQLNLLEKQIKQNQKLKAWLKIDTGMHRLGFLPKDFSSVWKRVNQINILNQPLGIMTHLADADNQNQDFTLQQLHCFSEHTQHLSAPKSISNSAAILAYKGQLADWVRPGIMLYGVSPFVGRVGQQEGLEPVMTLGSRLIAVKSLQKGDYVGYGCTWQAPEAMPIGVVAMGYGDGYPRHAKNGTPVLVNGVLCPLVGRVSMDMLTVDLRPVLNARVGDSVVLWGQGLPVETVAAYCDTIAYELFCGLTSRVKFCEVQ